MADAAPSAQPIERRYEIRDAAVRLLVLCGIGLCLLLVIALLGSGLLISYFTPTESRTANAPAAEPGFGRPSRPQLQTDPSLDLARMRHAEETLLDSYGWIDRQTGTVRIPIERAMDLVAAQHLGPRAQPSGAPEQPPRQSGR